tara:strand:- start:22 stop:456 length:435 start_codon:yes stop_codon:yes gene_type:complete
LTRAWLLVLLLVPSPGLTAPLTPQFTQGQLNSRSESVTTISEQITSYNFRTGYSYSAAGHNVETVGDVPITPEATVTNNQTVNGVNFSWTSPNAETKPQWQVVNPGASWSITESFLSPGLDAITNVTRTIQTTTTTESQSVFSQ